MRMIMVRCRCRKWVASQNPKRSLTRCRRRTKSDYSRSLTAERFAGGRKGDYFRMFREQRVDGALQIADAFAVDDPHAQNPALLTGRQIIEHEPFYFTWLKRVQVQDPVNRQLYRLVHGSLNR